jgi:signal transduction histidine kinase
MATRTASRLAFAALVLLSVALALPAVLLLLRHPLLAGWADTRLAAVLSICGALIALQLALLARGRLRLAEQRRQADQLRAEQARQAALRADVGVALAGKDHLPLILQRCAAAIVQHLDAAFARIWTLSDDETTLELQASAGLYARLDGRHSRIPMGQLKIGRIAQERKPHATNDVIHDPRVDDKAWAATEGMVAFAGYPLLAGDRVVGVMAMFSRAAISSGTLDTLGSIADALAQGIQRKRAEEALRKKDVLFSEGQRLSHTGSWAWIAATQELVWSEEHCRLLGYDPATTKPTLELFWQRVHPEDLPWMQHDFAEAVELKLGVDREFRVVLPDGTIKYLHGMDHAVLDEAGRLIEFVGTTVDVSDRKQAEAELYAARAELARVTRATTMGEFAASIAHEVNQPLAAVVANANACQRWLAREVPDVEQARAAAERIIRDGKRAGDVIAGMRALFKKSPVEVGPIDPVQVIQEVLDAIRPELIRHGILLQLSLDGKLPQVHGDPVQLRQVVLNLITNAIQAMSGVAEGARDLGIGVYPGDVDGVTGVVVKVADTGVGFGAEQAARLFDAFYTTKPEGLGMGLAISRSIVEALGGRLWAAPNPGRGATFCFVLPVSVP